MKILYVTSLSKRFQTAIPKLAREHLKLTAQDRVLWILVNGEVCVRKA